VILEEKLDFNDVMIVPSYSTLNSRKEVYLERTFDFKNGKRIHVLPVVASNMDTVGTYSMYDKLNTAGMMTAIHKHYDIQTVLDFEFDHIGQQMYRMLHTVGIDDSEFEKMQDISRCYANTPSILMINIDVANGYIQAFHDTISKYRKEFPDAIITAGNVVTPEGVELLAKAGADIIKIGIGSSGACLTRAKTGVGYPQFSCIVDCLTAADNNGVYLMSDGGCTNPGDIAKAFCAGADFVMIGGMLAGHDESEVNFVKDENGNETCLIYGMSSETAMKKYHGGVRPHRTSEGRAVVIRRKGPVMNTVMDIMGGLRSCGTYIGAKQLDEFHDKARFIRVNRQLNTFLGQ